MEFLRESQSTSVLLALIIAILAALLIGVGAFGVAQRAAGAPAHTNSFSAPAGSLSPDAQQRNEEILAARLDAAQATHGH